MTKTLSSTWLLLLFLSFNAYSQNGILEIDSLLTKAKKIYERDQDKGILIARSAYEKAKKHHLKSEELKSLNTIGILYWGARKYDQARFFTIQGLNGAIKYQSGLMSGDFWNTLGLISYSEGHYNQAIENYQKALQYFFKPGQERKMAITYMNIGMARKKLSNFEMANSDYFKAVLLFEKTADLNSLSGVYNSIGNNFSALKNFKNAIKYYRKALNSALKLIDTPLMAQSYNNIGYTYILENKSDSAIKYLNKTLDLRKQIQDEGELVLTLQNLSEAWKKKGALKKATIYLEKSISIAAQLNMKDELLRGYLDMSSLYLEKQAYEQALEYGNKSELLATELNSNDLLLESYHLKSSVFEKKNQYLDALNYEHKARKLYEKIFNLSEGKSILELEVKYETQQKNKDIAALNTRNALGQKLVQQQRWFIIVLGLLMVLLLVFSILIFKSYHQKKKANLYISNLMRELHHRVKNNLQILSALFTLQLADSDNELVKNSIWENEMRLNSMNLIHQKLYLHENETKINMKDYLEQLAKNIKISFGGKTKNISLNFEIEPITIEADKAIPIGLIVNELITNAFKYAVTVAELEIYIGFKRKQNSTYTLIVKDNGTAPLLQEQGQNTKPTFGIKLVEMMAKQLNSEVKLKQESGRIYHFDLPQLS